MPRTPREGESSEATEVLADAPRIVEALVAPTIPVAAGIVRAVNRFLLCLKNFEYADARSSSKDFRDDSPSQIILYNAGGFDFCR